ncbi:MAG: hypothetical protein ACR2MB_13385 [Acidimicrobiales bacterium]
MTEPQTPLSDEDLSAALDGEADPDVIARVQSDAAARARTEALRAASTAVAAPVTPLDPAVVDQLVARALQAADGHAAGQAAVGPMAVDPMAPVAPLSPRRGRRAGPPPWLVAAGIAVVVAVGLGLVWSGTRGSTDQATSSGGAKLDQASRAATSKAGKSARPSADQRAEDSGGVAGQAPLDGTGGGGADTTPPPINLGTFKTSADLRAALAKGFPTTPATATATAPRSVQFDRCIEEVRSTLNGARNPAPLPARPSHQGYAQVEAQPTLVFEFPTRTYQPGRTAVVTAVGTNGCEPVLLFVR